MLRRTVALVAHDVVPVDRGGARGRRDQRGQHPQGRRLAGAVGAEERDELARADLEVEAADGLDGVLLDREVAGEPAGDDRRSWSWSWCEEVMAPGSPAHCGHFLSAIRSSLGTWRTRPRGCCGCSPCSRPIGTGPATELADRLEVSAPDAAPRHRPAARPGVRRRRGARRGRRLPAAGRRVAAAAAARGRGGGRDRGRAAHRRGPRRRGCRGLAAGADQGGRADAAAAAPADGRPPVGHGRRAVVRPDRRRHDADHASRRAAATTRRCASATPRAAARRRERHVEPHRLVSLGRRWYLVGLRPRPAGLAVLPRRPDRRRPSSPAPATAPRELPADDALAFVQRRDRGRCRRPTTSACGSLRRRGGRAAVRPLVRSPSSPTTPTAASCG